MINLNQPEQKTQIETEIETRYKKISLENIRCSLEEIICCVEWISNIPAELRQKKACDLAYILLETFEKFPDWEKERKNEKLCEAAEEGIKMLALIPDADGSYIKCVRFLYELSQNISEFSKKSIGKNFFSFKDILEHQRGLFQLQNADGARIFPIHELVLSLAKDFKCDNEHLVNLAIAQQMFEKVREYEKVQEDEQIKKALNEIVEKHKIAFLKHLVEGGELFIDEADYKENGTLITKHDREIIIRNLKKSYFDGYQNGKIESEINNLAYFVKIQLDLSEEMVDFEEIIKNGTPESKMEILKAIDEQKIFNVFIPKRIVRNKNNHRFTKFLNPFKDNKIIFKETKKQCNRMGFLEIFSCKTAALWPKTLFKDEGDILTVDFYCAFYKEVVGEDWNLAPDLENEKNDFYQRNLISKYLNHVLEKKDENQTDALIERLYNFANKYFNYKNFKKETKIDGKLFGFPLFSKMPEGLQTKKWLENKKNEIFKQEKSDWEVGKLTYDSDDESWFLNDENSKNFKILNLDNDPLDDFELAKSSAYVFFSKKANEIIYDKNIKKLADELDFLNKINEKEMIKFDKNNIHRNPKIKKLILVMQANNFSAKSLEIFCREKKDYETLCFYKIFWHIQIHKFDNEKINKFLHLMVEKHYLGCIEDKETIEKYFQNLIDILENPQNNAMVLAKESYGNESTLNYLFENFGKKPRQNHLSWAFDGGIADNLERKNGQYFFRKKPLKKIIFMADNLMNGASLKKMLDFHLNAKMSEKRNYLKIDPSVKEIKENSKIDVEIHIIFGFSHCVDKIEQKYGVKIKIYKEIPQKFKSDDEMKKIIQELYGAPKEKIEDCCCVFRYNNLAAKTVFSKNYEHILEPENCAGLFQRKNELI